MLLFCIKRSQTCPAAAPAITPSTSSFAHPELVIISNFAYHRVTVVTHSWGPAQGVYLVGHSRGGKLSVLAAARDPRVTAACLLDPVDNTKYAPLGPQYPSAIAALHNLGMQVGIFSS